MAQKRPRSTTVSSDSSELSSAPSLTASPAHKRRPATYNHLPYGEISSVHEANEDDEEYEENNSEEHGTDDDENVDNRIELAEEWDSERVAPVHEPHSIDINGRTIHYCNSTILGSDGLPQYLPKTRDNGIAKDLSELRKEAMEERANKMADWVKNVDVVQVSDVTLEQLEARTANIDQFRNASQAYMLKVEEDIKAGKQDIRYFSTKVVDANGKMLVSVASHSLNEMRSRPECPRTFKCDAEFKEYMSRLDDNEKVYHGLEKHSLEFIAVHTQSYVGLYGVTMGKSDVRHNNHKENWKRFSPDHYYGERNEWFMFQSSVPPHLGKPAPGAPHQYLAEQRREYNQNSDTRTVEENLAGREWYREASGVIHQDRCWPERGKETSKRSIPGRSKEAVGGASYKSCASLRNMSTVNLYIQELLLPSVLASMPTSYEQIYRPTYLAAAMNEEEERKPGFHTGHVIVYKQVVHQHQDKGDSGFCITFNTGSYTGGYLVFADLGLVFRYQPGDTVIFRSRALYHGVTTWIPDGDIDRLGVTPGRVAHVLYTKFTATDFTKGKEAGWARKTNVGTMPGYEHPRVEEDFPSHKALKNNLSYVRYLGFRNTIFRPSKLYEAEKISLPSHSSYISKIVLAT